MRQTIPNSQVELIMIIMPITIFYIGYVKLRQLSSDIAWTETPYSVLWAPGYFHLAVMLNTLGTANGGRCCNCFGEEQDQYPGTLHLSQITETHLRVPILLMSWRSLTTVYPKKYAHGFVVLCFVVVIQSFIMNSHEVFIHIHQGCFAGTGAIVRLPQCQWSKPDGYGKISQCLTTTKHSKAKTCAYFLGYTVHARISN